MPVTSDDITLSISFSMSPQELELFTDIDINKINESIATKAKDFWVTLAGQNMNTTREIYIESIAMEPAGSTAWRVHLGELGKRPNFAAILEVGSDAYDLKPGFIKSGMAKRIIPINSESGSPDFRVVRRGDPGWEHPGFVGRKFQDQVVEEVADNIINDVVDEWFQGNL